MKPARYIFLNHGLGMSPGKCAAQAAHAETLAMHEYMTKDSVVRTPPSSLTDKERIWAANQVALFSKWFGDGHYAKYVMKADDSMQMYTIERYLEERGFETYMVIDEGHTEGTVFVPTALAVELVDKDDERVASIFNEFRLYRVNSGPRDTSQSEGSPWNWRRWPWTN